MKVAATVLALLTIMPVQIGLASPGRTLCLNYDICMAKARAYLKTDLNQAFSHFQQALQLKPGDPKAFISLQMLEPYIRDIPGTCPEFMECMRLGYEVAKREDYKAALVHFKRALRFDPGNNYALEAIGIVAEAINSSR